MRRLEEFAEYAGVGATTLYNLTHGRRSPRGTWVRPSLSTLTKLSSALGMPLSALVNDLEPQGVTLETGGRQGTRAVRVPLEVAGVVPAERMLATESHVYVEAVFARGRTLRAFRVHGDSMAAGSDPIHDGDVVLVDTNDKGSNAASVVALLTDDNYVCKMLKDDRFGTRLYSRNVEHTNGTPSSVAMDGVKEIVGRVVRIIHDLA